MPPPAVIAAALRVTTEALARELALPADRAPRWNAFEWRVARASLAIHGIAPLLAGRLRWSGPDGWDQFLQQQRAHVLQRQQLIDALLLRIDAAALQEKMSLLALKGAALHRLGICRAGERPMGDIDLLTDRRHMARASQLLLALGYRHTTTTWRHLVFEPVDGPVRDEFGELPDGRIKIELHSHVAERLPATAVDITAALLTGDGAPGLHDYQNRSALLLHLLLHAAGNMSSKWLRLLQLHDIAAVAARMCDDDWRQLLEHQGVARSLWWAYPPALLSLRYLQAPIPDWVVRALRAQCRPWLCHIAEHSSLTDVSSSSLWVRAAPGIVWAQSPAEVCRYLARRIRPAADEMAAMGKYAAAQSWAADGGWYSLSQYRRIWHWLAARPARPQILQAVRLAQSGF